MSLKHYKATTTTTTTNRTDWFKCTRESNVNLRQGHTNNNAVDQSFALHTVNECHWEYARRFEALTLKLKRMTHISVKVSVSVA